MYLLCIEHNKQSGVPPSDYETPVETSTGLEMKSNTAYGTTTGLEMKSNSAYGQVIHTTDKTGGAVYETVYTNDNLKPTPPAVYETLD